MRRSNCYWHTACIQATIKCSNQVYSCMKNKTKILPSKSNHLIIDIYVSINIIWDSTQKVKWVTKSFNRLLFQSLVSICSASLITFNCTVLSMKNQWQQTKLKPDIIILVSSTYMTRKQQVKRWFPQMNYLPKFHLHISEFQEVECPSKRIREYNVPTSCMRNIWRFLRLLPHAIFNFRHTALIYLPEISQSKMEPWLWIPAPNIKLSIPPYKYWLQMSDCGHFRPQKEAELTIA